MKKKKNKKEKGTRINFKDLIVQTNFKRMIKQARE